MRVPSTLKCSSLARPGPMARSRTAAKNAAVAPQRSSLGRLCAKAEASKTRSDGSIPQNQRKSRSVSMRSTSWRSLRTE